MSDAAPTRSTAVADGVDLVRDTCNVYVVVDPGETKTVTAGQHTNVGKVTATPVDAVGTQIGAPVADQDLGNWNGTVAKLGSYVFRDANANGLMDGSESGVGGVQVNLLNSTGAVIFTCIISVCWATGY